MPFTALKGFPSLVAGESAGSRKLADAAPAADATTIASFGTSTTRRAIQWQPGVTNTATAVPGAATALGWHILKAENNRTANLPARALISAGVWTFAVSVRTTSADATGASPTLSAYVYKRSATGVYTALFNATSAGFNVTTASTLTVSWSSATQPAVTFETDETLHVEFWVNAQGVAVTSNTYQMNIGPLSAVTFPLAAGQTSGIASNHPRSHAVTGVGLAARGGFLIRRTLAVTAAGVVTAARRVTAARTFALTALGSAGFARRVTAVRGFAVTSEALPRLRLGIPEEAMDRIAGGGAIEPGDFAPNDGLVAIAGVVRDVTGTPVAGATVRLHRQSDDYMAATVTTGPGGVYSFARGSADPNLYYVSVFAPGQLGGLSRRDLVPA